MKKIMFFAYDGTGLGHLMRLIKIALGLSEFCKVLVVSGHKALPFILFLMELNMLLFLIL